MYLPQLPRHLTEQNLLRRHTHDLNVLAAAIFKNYAKAELMMNRACENYLQYFPAAFSRWLLNVPSGNLSMSNIALR